MRLLKLLELLPQLFADFDDALDWQLTPGDGSSPAWDTPIAAAGSPMGG